METKRTEFASKAFRFSKLEEDVEIGRAYLFIIRNDLHKKPYGLLEDVFINENYRGKGVATELVQEVIREAQRQECYKLICNAKIGVHGLYTQLGFRVSDLGLRMDFK